MINDNVHYLNTDHAPTANRSAGPDNQTKSLTGILNAIVSRQLSMGHELIALRAVNAIALSHICKATSDPVLAAQRIDRSLRAFAETLEITCELEEDAKRALTDTLHGVVNMMGEFVGGDHAN